MDKRISKSIEKIKSAYLDLLFKKDPDKIQVKDLCNKAGVNRSTFYDRFGFMEKIEKEIIEDEIRSVSFAGYQLDSLPTENNGIDKNYIRTYINAFCNSRILMRFCTAENRAKYVDIILHAQVELCTSELSKINYYDAYFQAVGATSTIIEWVNDKKGHSLEEVVEIVYRHSISMFGN